MCLDEFRIWQRAEGGAGEILKSRESHRNHGAIFRHYSRLSTESRFGWITIHQHFIATFDDNGRRRGKRKEIRNQNTFVTHALAFLIASPRGAIDFLLFLRHPRRASWWTMCEKCAALARDFFDGKRAVGWISRWLLRFSASLSEQLGIEICSENPDLHFSGGARMRPDLEKLFNEISFIRWGRKSEKGSKTQAQAF